MRTARVLGTGEAPVGHGLRSINSAREPAVELVNESGREIRSAAFLTKLKRILNLPNQAAGRGIGVTLVPTRLDAHHRAIRRKLRRTDQALPHCRVASFRNRNSGTLHARAIVVDRRKVIGGSANLTEAGMPSNHEIALMLKGEKPDNSASFRMKLSGLHSPSTQREGVDRTGRLR